MTRAEFHALFHTAGPVILPVIHVLDTPRTLDNVGMLVDSGAPGCFLINHDFDPDRFMPIIQDVRDAHASLWLGVNFLAVTGRYAFPMLADLHKQGCRVDAYWADDARIDEHGVDTESADIAAIRTDSGWDGLYFGGTCFKKQRVVDPAHYAAAARLAVDAMDVVTTSGGRDGTRGGPWKSRYV